MLESAITFLQHADPLAIYVFLFLIAFFENVIPPIPGDLPIAFTGYLIYNSNITFASSILWASLGSTSGFMLIFLLSKHFGLKLYSGSDTTSSQYRWLKTIHRFFPPSDMELLRGKFAAHGYLAVLINRFLFGSRAVISVLAGLMHLKTPFVLIAAFLSATTWNVLLLYGGYFLRSNWKDIGSYVIVYSIPLSVSFVLLLLFSAWKFFKEKKAET
ncbi:MAG: DedA family protein [Chlorobiaceae bacterium]